MTHRNVGITDIHVMIDVEANKFKKKLTKVCVSGKLKTNKCSLTISKNIDLRFWDGKESSWQGVKLARSQAGKESSWQGVKLARSQVGKESSWQGVKLARSQVDNLSRINEDKNIRRQGDQKNRKQVMEFRNRKEAMNMCSHQVLEKILSELAKAYRKTYKDNLSRIILYGSYARGDYRDDSDIDVVAIVKGPRRKLQDDLMQVWDTANDLELEYETIVSPTVIPLDEYEQYKDVLPYYRNIEKEGILISG